MAICDSILRRLLTQLLFRPRVIRRPTSLESVTESSRRLYATEANRWGVDPTPATRSFISSGSDRTPGAEADQAADRPEPSGRRFGLRTATTWPAPSGLLACGAIDRVERRFSDRGR